MISSNVFLCGIGMSLLLMMILLQKHILKMSKIYIINRLKILLPLMYLCKHLVITHIYTFSISSIILKTFFWWSIHFRNNCGVHHCNIGDIWFSLPVDLHKPVNLTLLSTSWVEEIRGIHDSLGCLANLITSVSLESNKDSPLALFLMADWNETKKYCFLIQSIEISLVIKPMHAGKCAAQRCDSLKTDSFEIGI